MSGYEKTTLNSSISLMAGRLGFSTRDSSNDTEMMYLDGVADQQLRLGRGGGYTQRERMVLDKRRSLDKALKYSYQAAEIKRVQCIDNLDNTESFEFCKQLDEHETCWALINPDKTKMDYDDKIISVHYEENYHPGDVFEWLGTNSKWMIYLQDLTEIAYFRGEIRRCDYEISWEVDGNTYSTYAAVRGPVETKIDSSQKHTTIIDSPNYSLIVYIPKTECTLEHFQRYTKFYLQGMDEGTPVICWRTEAVDTISTPGIIEIAATEYYVNESEDDVEAGIVGGLIKPIEDPNEGETADDDIVGDTFIKPKKAYKFTYTGLNAGKWSIKEKNVPVRLKVNESNPLEVYVRWESSYNGQFTLQWGKEYKIVVVESLF